MDLKGHYFEQPPKQVGAVLQKYDHGDHKVNLWNAFVDTDLIGINDDDCHILPRVLPGSYLQEIKKVAQEITLFSLRLLSLPEREIRTIIPPGPIRDFLLDELEVLRYRPQRLTGSLRFDMAIVGSPERGNPPKLLEINEIGFDGLARSSQIQETLFSLMPELRTRVVGLDTAGAEARNMRRLGESLARFQKDTYNWEEEVLIQKARAAGVGITLASPWEFKYQFEKDFPLLTRKKVSLSRGRLCVGESFVPDAVGMGFSFELKDYKEGRELYRKMVQSETPQYSPFITGLIASKMILVLFSDLALRRRLLGTVRSLEQVIISAQPLQDCRADTQENYERRVLKHVDGMGGEMVFIGEELKKRLKTITSRDMANWVVQQRVALNKIGVNGILSRPRSVISDLGVFVQYDWARGKFRHFEVGGFISRATNRSYKVNVSGGGIQVPVMFTRL